MDRVLTRWELSYCLRSELQSMFDQISVALPNLPEGSLGRRIALINLENIRRELVYRDMTTAATRF